MTVRKAQSTLSDSEGELGTGYLDDWIYISFGIDDKSSHFVVVPVEDLLEDHDMCKDFFANTPTGWQDA